MVLRFRSILALLFLITMAAPLTVMADNAEFDLPPGTEIQGIVGEYEQPQVADDVIYLDADTPATGSLLETTPLVTPAGTITCPVVEIRSSTADPDIVAVGAAGDGFDIENSPVSYALMEFDFDVASFTFIYGGNIGSCYIEARNAGGAMVDSFFQADTGDGQPAGPETLAGAGIRSVYWEDPGGNYLVLDNIEITPESATAVEPASWGAVKTVFR